MSENGDKLTVQLSNRNDQLDLRYIQNIDKFEAKEEGVELYADGEQAGFVPYSKLRVIAPGGQFPRYVKPDEADDEGES